MMLHTCVSAHGCLRVLFPAHQHFLRMYSLADRVRKKSTSLLQPGLQNVYLKLEKIERSNRSTNKKLWHFHI